MTHDQFLKLTEEEQFGVFKHKAVRIASCYDDSHKYVLFQIDSFYLEGKLEPMKTKIIEFFSFSGTDRLDKYLDTQFPESKLSM